MNSLKVVNALIRANKHKDALNVVEQLLCAQPKFWLYVKKKEECQLALSSKKIEIVILLATCDKYIEKIKAIQETWGKQAKLNYKVIYAIGKPNLNSPYVDGDFLYVNCRDDYESLLLKLVLAFEYIYNNYEFDYIYKIDDDCYLNIDLFEKNIKDQLDGRPYLSGAIQKSGEKINPKWHYGKCSSSSFDVPYMYDAPRYSYGKGGYGYFLNKKCLPFIVDKKNILREELDKGIYSYEDMRMSEILAEYEVFVESIANYSVLKGSLNEQYSNQLIIYDINNLEIYKKIQGVLHG